MDSMFQQLRKLYDNELYANVIPIVSKILNTQRRQLVSSGSGSGSDSGSG